MSVADFKAAANEVGNWFWGTVKGGFNEKQSIGHIVTDAVISMFPIAGEVTAARDCIAAGIRLAEDPQKREETIEWVALALPLLAIIPLLGGALKGIGKLLMLAGKNIDHDRKILESMVWLLNKIGHGDAYKFIRELDFSRYAGPVTKGARDALQRVADGLAYVRKKFGALIPDEVARRMDAIQVQLTQVVSLVDKMIPQALKDLNNKLKHIQKLLYQGDWHLIPGAGRAVTRETEARLVYSAAEGKNIWKLENARFPQNPPDAFIAKEGYPNLKYKETKQTLKNEERILVNEVVSAFSGPMYAREIGEGKILYRVITNDEWSKAEGTWWTATDPKTITGWYW